MEKKRRKPLFRVSKKPANTGHKAKAHLDKLNKIMAASKELRCGVTASITEKVAEIKRLKRKYSIHVLCEALQLPRGTITIEKREVKSPISIRIACGKPTVIFFGIIVAASPLVRRVEIHGQRTVELLPDRWNHSFIENVLKIFEMLRSFIGDSIHRSKLLFIGQREEEKQNVKPKVQHRIQKTSSFFLS